MRALKPAIRMTSMLFNWVRLSGLPDHRRRVRQARCALRTIQTMQGTAVEARLFSYLRKIDPLVFEELVLCAIEQAGALVVRNLRYSGDGGIDGRAWIPGTGWCAIQAKRYGSHIIRDHVAAFGDTLTRTRCKQRLFIHCGRTGTAVYQHLADRRIVLVSGQRLAALIGNSQLPPVFIAGQGANSRE
jgi:restriction system protein